MCLGFCLVGDKKHTHTELDGHRYERPQMKKTRSIIQVCNKPNEETYPGPLLVNIELLYPHRE